MDQQPPAVVIAAAARMTKRKQGLAAEIPLEAPDAAHDEATLAEAMRELCLPYFDTPPHLIASAMPDGPPGPGDVETTWSKYLAGIMHGVAEHICPDRSRIDVLTTHRAWEVDWPYKWAEAISQARLYAKWAYTEGGVILLTGRDSRRSEQPYLLRALAVAPSDIPIVCFDVNTRKADKPVMFEGVPDGWIRHLETS